MDVIDPNMNPMSFIEPGKRASALIIDVLACYLIAILASVIPLVGRFLPIQTTLLLLLLCKDYYFKGRGIGKNVMGLKVVDARTGQPPSLAQSMVRNIILFAPMVMLQLSSLILSFIRAGQSNESIMNLVNMVGMIYIFSVLPLESYRAYSRRDGLRVGDRIAGTTIIEAPMDFSQAPPEA